MPAYLSSVPILGNLLKGVCKRAVQRLLEDVEAIVTEMNRGTALEDVLQGSKSGSNNSMLDNRYNYLSALAPDALLGSHQCLQATADFLTPLPP